MDETELAEAFGYHDNLEVTNFEDEEYALDTDGLCLVQDSEITGLCSAANVQSCSEEDKDLAATHGYGDENVENVVDIAAAHGYYDASESTLDDDELAAAFGYSNWSGEADTDSPDGRNGDP